MFRNSILCSCYMNLFLFITCFLCFCFSYEEYGSYNSFSVSSISYSKTKLKPYEWRYIRVELPLWFSSMSIALESDVDIDTESTGKIPKSTLPMICFRNGSPPLPDVSNTTVKDLVLGTLSNGSFGVTGGLQNTEQCYPMQKNITTRLTNEQISPGVWYFGVFNGIGPMRTQSKMISRGSSYTFSANVSVEGCTTSTMSGQYCNQTVNPLSCVLSDSSNFTESLSIDNQTTENFISCRSSFENSCHVDGEPKIYFLDVMGLPEQLSVTVMNVRFNGTSSNFTGNVSEINVMCLARHGTIPLPNLDDYSTNINKAPLVIRSPKVGRWYFTILPVNLSKEIGGIQDPTIKVCYSMEWKVLECPLGKAGLNCTQERYMLQTVLRRNPTAFFESYYLPVSEKVSPDSANFPLEPLLSNYSNGGELGDAWTYFLMDVPHGAAAGNIHIQLTSDVKINYEIYARFGALPTHDTWDYFYANKTSSSDGSMFFMLYNSSEESVNFYILYVREGSWNFGLRYLNSSSSTSTAQTTMSISLERCPKRCSSHGQCQSAVDASGLTFYSYCACDRNHGGFDCSVEIVSHQGHIWQSISLIASNAAAVLPAYWALRQKAFAEWVLFTSSGISSGLYHACDVGTWCALSFHVLQFMDFWLSFMAVVSTFVYLAAIDEGSKRTIHTAVSILTALMAATEATRSANIILVIAIGALGLLVGWLIEFSTKFRSFSFTTGFHVNVLHRWQTIRDSLRSLIKTLLKRFRWGFVLAGFVALAMAAISWKLETSESYWIWHSMWHVSIYTSSFLFLCSKADYINNEDEGPPDGNYELARQDSLPRGP